MKKFLIVLLSLALFSCSDFNGNENNSSGNNIGKNVSIAAPVQPSKDDPGSLGVKYAAGSNWTRGVVYSINTDDIAGFSTFAGMPVDTAKSMVKEAAQKWNTTLGKIVFQFCADPSHTYPIKFLNSTSAAENKVHGYPPGKNTTDMSLINNNWFTNNFGNNCGDNAKHAFRNVVFHEFGHVLGLFDNRQGNHFSMCYPTLDPSSIMDYNNTHNFCASVGDLNTLLGCMLYDEPHKWMPQISQGTISASVAGPTHIVLETDDGFNYSGGSWTWNGNFSPALPAKYFNGSWDYTEKWYLRYPGGTDVFLGNGHSYTLTIPPGRGNINSENDLIYRVTTTFENTEVVYHYSVETVGSGGGGGPFDF